MCLRHQLHRALGGLARPASHLALRSFTACSASLHVTHHGSVSRFFFAVQLI